MGNDSFDVKTYEQNLKMSSTSQDLIPNGSSKFHEKSDLQQQMSQNTEFMKCPRCKEGFLRIRFTSRFNKFFIGCTNFPKCKRTMSFPNIEIKDIKIIDESCDVCTLSEKSEVKKIEIQFEEKEIKEKIEAL